MNPDDFNIHDWQFKFKNRMILSENTDKILYIIQKAQEKGNKMKMLKNDIKIMWELPFMIPKMIQIHLFVHIATNLSKKVMVWDH